MESFSVYFQDNEYQPILILFGVLLIIAASMFNGIGVYITKTINALGRSILDTGRAALVWIVGIIVTAAASDSRFRWE